MALDAGAAVSRLLRVEPSRIDGHFRAPPSKSLTHRAFLLAAQGVRPCRVAGPLQAADTRSTLDALRRLGAQANLLSSGDVQFEPAPALHASRQPIDCGNAGTTLRLLTATCARFDEQSLLTGDASLQTRPNGPLLTALAGLGARHSSNQGKAPLRIRGPLRAGTVTLPGAGSSQFASALLLSLPFVAGPSRLRLQPPIASAPYLDLTLDVARRAGLAIEQAPTTEAPTGLDAPAPEAAANQAPAPKGRAFTLPGSQTVTATCLEVEGDWSAAAFPLVAAATTGGRAVVQGLDPASRQGDRRLLDHLAAFGARVQTAAAAVTVQADAASLASPGDLDVAATPDLFPALAVLAAASRGTTTLTGGTGLRTKESDRIAAMAAGLHAMGIQVLERPDGLVVHGGRLRGATVASHGDHRIHMALTLAGLVADGPTHVDGPASAAVSYPGFHQHLEEAGARLTLVGAWP